MQSAQTNSFSRFLKPLSIFAVAFPCLAPSPAQSIEPDTRTKRHIERLVQKTEDCATRYTFGKRRMDAYCVVAYEALVDLGVDGTPYAEFCNHYMMQYLEMPDTDRCNRAFQMRVSEKNQLLPMQ